MTDADILRCYAPELLAQAERDREEILASVGPFVRLKLDQDWDHHTRLLSRFAPSSLTAVKQVLSQCHPGDVLAWLGFGRPLTRPAFAPAEASDWTLEI